MSPTAASIPGRLQKFVYKQSKIQKCPPNPVMAGFHPHNDFQLTLVVLFEVSIGAVPNRPKGHVNKRFQK